MGDLAARKIGAIARRKISVYGVVQGVGFRPFVYRLAHEHELAGWVLNHSGGVNIEVEGPLAVLDVFLHDLQAKAPPLACIEGISAADYPPNGYTTFEIRESRAEEGRYQLISPDIATCLDCQRELFDPTDRRYRYPFTNCTNCGPRFTIIKDIPYDRPLTTMRDFVMCSMCQSEYGDPLDRRFHAQPNACPVCGPQVWLEVSEELGVDPYPLTPDPLAKGNEALLQAAGLLREGAILAIKGLGGFHLACDATNQAAVRLLRARKRRPAKPLAVMMATMEEIRQHCCLSEGEEQLLTSPQCPIVLLPWKESSNVCELVAPRYEYLGVMLPYTPLHHVLLRDVKRPLVMTSGNLSEEPIAQENEEALRRLGRLADYFLLHNRDIHARYDDSVWQVCKCASMQVDQQSSENLQTCRSANLQLLQPMRRARGYAPFPISLPFVTKHILACGAELKNTFCLTREEYAFLSQHIGDMENLETLEHFEITIELYKRLFRIEPGVIAYDLHPEYLATKYAKSQISNLKSQIPVQHHHAHIAACLADNGWPAEGGPVIGVAFDGTGYGTDGHIWGGEFLVADYHGFRRAGHLEYLPMPGGEAAIKNPYRLALSYLYTLLGRFPSFPAFPFLTGVNEIELHIIKQQIDRGVNSPLTSACGRLFDAVAALIGVRGRVTYEAQAAIELEMISTAAVEAANRHATEGYPFGIDRQDGRTIIRLRELFEGIIADLREGVSPAEIGLRFHHTVVRMIVEMCQCTSRDTGLRTVALSGGCFQNRLLLSKTVVGLREAGLEVLVHREVPCNDGGISLGQAVIANFAVERR